MKQKTLFQKGMKAAVLSLMLAVGVMSPGYETNVSVAAATTNWQYYVKIGVDQDLSALHLKLMDDSGELVQGSNDWNAPITPIKITTTKYVEPGATDFGEGGYYIPEGFLDGIQLPSGLSATIENNVITISGQLKGGRSVTLPEAPAQKKRLASEMAEKIAPVGIQDGWKQQLLFSGGTSEMEYDDGWGYWKNYTSAAGIYKDMAGGYRYKTTSEYPVSEKFVVYFGDNYHEVKKGSCEHGTMTISINGIETSLAEEQGHSSQQSNPHTVLCPMVEVKAEKGYFCTAIKMDGQELEMIDDCKAYITNMPNHDVTITAEFIAKSDSAYTVAITNPEGSNLKLADGSGELTQKGDTTVAIDPIIIETTKYVVPGSDTIGDGGFYVEEGCLDSLKQYGLNVTYTGNSITITGKPNADVNITLPNAQPQSNTVRTVSDKICYLGKGVWKVLDPEICYAGTDAPKADTEWTSCSDGIIDLKSSYGYISFKYPETLKYPVSEYQTTKWDDTNCYYTKVKIEESEYGKISLSYNGIETNWLEIKPVKKYVHKYQYPTATVTPIAGYRCTGLKLTTEKKTKKFEVSENNTAVLEYTAGNGEYEVSLSAEYEAIQYSITSADAENGSVSAAEGEIAVEVSTVGKEITINIKPADGYELASVTVKTKDGKEVKVTDNKFAMPAGDVVITPVFKMTQAKQDELAAEAAATLINNIGNVTYTDGSKALIDAARAAYDALTADQKALVPETTLAVLTDAEAAYASLKAQAEAAANQAAADTAVNAIDAIGNVAYSDASKALIDAARAAYNALTEDQKALVAADKLTALTNAEATYASLKQQADALKSEEEKREEEEKLAAEAKKAADQAAANAAADKIDAIGNVAYSDASKALIDAARSAYDALTADQKALIQADKLTVLTNAETTYTTLTATALAPKLEQKKAGKNSIAITWKEDKKATAGYRIYIKGGSYKKFTKVADTKKGVTSYTIKKAKNKKLAAGTQYEIKIVSLKKSGKKTVELSTQKLKAVTVTAAPKFTSAKRSKNGKQLTLKWKKVSGASGYELQMSTKAKTGYKTIATCKAKVTSYTKKGLTKSKTYYFRMRTYKTINGKKFYSSWSAVKKVSKVK